MRDVLDQGGRDESRARQELSPGGDVRAAQVGEEQERLLQLVQRSLGAGVPLSDDLRRRAESWFGRDLGDVRVHDSEQAASLARKLGAEALTIKSHVFGPAEKLKAETAGGRGLLAHEITHVVQQTDPGEVPWRGSHGGQSPFAGAPERHDRSLYGMSDHDGGQLRVQRKAVDWVSLQVSQDIVQRETEQEAQVNEIAAGNAAVVQRTAEEEGQGPTRTVDASEIAARVYRLMIQDLTLERDRGALPA